MTTLVIFEGNGDECDYDTSSAFAVSALKPTTRPPPKGDAFLLMPNKKKQWHAKSIACRGKRNRSHPGQPNPVIYLPTPEPENTKHTTCSICRHQRPKSFSLLAFRFVICRSGLRDRLERRQRNVAGERRLENHSYLFCSASTHRQQNTTPPSISAFPPLWQHHPIWATNPSCCPPWLLTKLS